MKIRKRDPGDTIWQLVLLSTELLGIITSCQPDGIYEDMQVFTTFNKWATTGDRLPKYYTNGDISTKLMCIDAVLTPWLAIYGISRLPKLFACLVHMPSIVMLHAVATANQTLLHFLLRNCYYQALNIHPPLDAAAITNNLPLLRELYHFGYTSSSYTMVFAAGHGNLEMVQFLPINEPRGVITAAISLAISNGHIDVVDYLRQYSMPLQYHTDSIVINLVNLAAENGRLEMLKYLHRLGWHGNELGLLAAIEYGHLDVVKFIHDQGPLWMVSWAEQHHSMMLQWEIISRYSIANIGQYEFESNLLVFFSWDISITPGEHT
ncbi:Aste57867_20301 [Aphanomyces stellatus]|uniref:Aste57867_20301 protein n=1 Tax=Aphanomyces stellatus TaxID=120398 RepID=A0A485LG72_9STRA|nr:hypothetical protein As57867_020235 [Aphanomyces stellatus]VFT96990.1 Aste57867_20301 [Aphanomyces stellatus]